MSFRNPRPTQGITFPRSSALVQGYSFIIGLSFIAVSVHSETILRDSFGFGTATTPRLDFAGNPISVGPQRPELNNVQVEFTSGGAAVWMAPDGKKAAIWSFSSSSVDPTEAASATEPAFNGSVTALGGTNVDALLPFTPPAGAYQVSADFVAGGAGLAIGLSSSRAILNNNFATYGQVWLSLGGGGQGNGATWTLHTAGGATLSGTALLQAYNPVVLIYDPAAHVVRGLVNGVPTGDLTYAATGISAVGFEGAGTVDNFLVETAQAAVAPLPAKIASATPTSEGLEVQWEGGTPPFVVQKRDLTSISSWTDLVTTQDHSVFVARDSAAAIVRIQSGGAGKP
jgi:hypothetical protein